MRAAPWNIAPWTLLSLAIGCGAAGDALPDHAYTWAPPVAGSGSGDAGRGGMDTGVGTPEPHGVRQLEAEISGPMDADEGCPTAATLVLTNTGDLPVTVPDITAAGVGWEVEAVPAVLEAGEKVWFPLRRSATLDGDASPGLAITTDADAVTGNFQGWTTSPAAAPVTTVEATVPRLDALDILFVTSPYMLEQQGYDQSPLFHGLPGLGERLTAAGVDWQLTVVGNSQGCPSAEWPLITAETEGWGEPVALSEMLTGPLKCSVIGRELAIARTTLRKREPGLCGDVVHRPDTPTLVLLLRGGRGDMEPGWDAMLDDMEKNLDGDPLRVDELVWPGDAYGLASDHTGGLEVDADTWQDGLGAYVGGLPVVHALSFPVDPAGVSGIEVTVDGVPDHDWVYRDGHVTWLEGAHPDRGAEVSVRYVDAAACPSRIVGGP